MPQARRHSTLPRLMLALILSGAVMAFLRLPTGGPSPTEAAGCPVAAGAWKGNFKQHINVTSTLIPGRTLKGDIDQSGLLDVNVGCDGKVTGGFKSVSYHQTETTIQGGSETVVVVCDGKNMTYDITDGTVAKDGGRVVFTLKVLAHYSAMTCKDGGVADRANTITLRSTSVAVKTLKGTGGVDAFEDAFHQMVAEAWEALGPVKQSSDWTLEYANPVLGPIEPKLVRFFLAGIPLQNTYTVAVEWNKSKPGKVIFKLGPRSAEEPAPGGEASHAFNIGSLQRTTNLEVKAVSADGIASAPQRFRVVIVPVPSWARPADLKPAVQGNHVLYRGSIDYPGEPWNALGEVPKSVPYGWGQWGIRAAQLKLGLAVNSAGGPASAPITGKGNFILSDSAQGLRFAGNTTTRLSPTGLTFDDTEVTLKVPPFGVPRQEDLLDILPKMKRAYAIPLVGDLVESLGGAVRMKGTVKGSLSGKLPLKLQGGAIAAGPGRLAARGELVAAFETTRNGAFVVAAGEDDWALFVKIDGPRAKLDDCAVSFHFTASGGVTGGQVVREGATIGFLGCGA